MTTRIRLLEIGAFAGIAAALSAALAVPPEATQGDLARMLFVHVPSIWLAYLSFTVTLVASAAYLKTKSLRWDRAAGASAEIGVVFTGAAILSGMIWGKPTWGVWWTWDARLVLTAVLFFVYLGYLALRRSTEDPTARARRSAIFGMLAVVQIPIVHFSVVWWRTLHQQASIARPGGLEMDPPFVAAFLAALVAFTVVYVALLVRRIELASTEDEIEAALRRSDLPVAGAAVVTPDLRSADV
ncbi:MAG: cytochrome c biogenesis protein CcsA [Acidimicrobiia bacterium]